MSYKASDSEAFFNRIDHHTLSNAAYQASLGNADILRECLQNGQPWDVSDNRGWFPIHCASYAGHASCVQVLLEHSEKNFITTISYNGETPLFLAASQGHSKVMEMLLSHGADINNRNNELVSVLLAAIKSKNKNCVQICLDNNVNIDAQDAGGWAAYHEAAFLGDKECLQLLLSVGGDVNIRNSDKATPVFVAAQYGHVDCLNMLIKEQGSVNLSTKDKASPLFIASQEGHLECVKSLIDAGAKVNGATTDFSTALHTAAERGHVDVIQLLINAGADINAKSKDDVTPLHLAADGDELNCLMKLIESGADIKAQLKKDRGTALELAATVGSVKCCEELIKKGCDPNRCFKKNDTLPTTTLMEAVNANENSCIEILLRYGADPNKQCYSYPIIVATKELNPLGISLLLQYDADVDVIDKASNTALYMILQKLSHYSPHNEEQNSVKLECAKILLKAGADYHSALSRNSAAISRFPLAYSLSVDFAKLLWSFYPNDSKVRKYMERHCFRKDLMELLNNPSSLLHLSRMRIRQLLQKNRLSKIHMLPISELMQNYLNFSDL